uniref:prostaglandin-endoperoxide synthase n=1 Tax=Entonomenia tricarinata TaxID=1541969 RepID=A0A0U2K3D4_9MOLL|nr:cyclooxygenase [Entonomenia tricarinata]
MQGKIAIVLAVMAVLAVARFGHSVSATTPESKGYHPCCSFPCQNQGVCTSRGFSDYECDCTNLPFYGRNCEHPTFWKRIGLFFKPSPYTRHNLLVNNAWLWKLLDNFRFMKNILMRMVYLDRGSKVHSPPIYTSAHEYVTAEAAYNMTYYARSLPPVHKNCPTPMGVAGRSVLPDAQLVVDTLLKRDKFKPDLINHNVLLPAFAQHFTHQFFRTDFKKGWEFQYGRHGVDVSHIYGPDKHTENLLRTHRGGLLKSQMIKGEEYPPYLKDAPVNMRYPKNSPESCKFALGHEFYSMLPTLFLYGTVWLREHNRVAALLAEEHPDWSDEQLFQTTKLIIMGETMQIVIKDYVQTLSNYHLTIDFTPEVLFDTSYQYQNRITLEFDHLYHFHPMMPDDVHIGNKVYSIQEMMFHPEIIVEHGVAASADSLTKQAAGAMTYRNHGKTTLDIAKNIIIAGRNLRLQPFNNYRKRFGLPRIESFYELTGNQEIADEMEQLYGDIDALEFYVGLLTEKQAENGTFGFTLLEMGASYSVKGLLSNPLCSPDYWKPSTFGGQAMFDMMKQATLEKLFCNNIKETCPDISFYVSKESVNKEKCSGSNCPKTDL